MTNIGATDAIHLAAIKEIECNILVTRDNDFRQIADEFILPILPEQINSTLRKLKNH